MSNNDVNLEALMICHNCGKSNSDSAKFCTGCGASLLPQTGKVVQQPPIPSNNKKYSGLIIVLIIIVSLIVVAIAGFCVYHFLWKKSPDNDVDAEKAIVTEMAEDNNGLNTKKPSKQQKKKKNKKNKINRDDTSSIETEGQMEYDSDTDDSVLVTEDPQNTIDTYRCFVYKNNDYDARYYPCIQLYSNGSFTYTENLGSGMGKLTGSYIEKDGIITADATYSDFSDLNSFPVSFVFKVTESSIIMIGEGALPVPNAVYVRDDNYTPSDSFFIDESNLGFSSECVEPSVIFNSVRKATVNTVHGLFIRYGPNQDTYDTILLMPYQAVVSVYGTNDSYSWYYVDYNGVYGWCSGEYLTFY